MGKYLMQASYTQEGVKGLMQEGGTKRRSMIEEMIGKAGGRLESFYYAFGDTDVYLIAELPDAATASAVALAINSSGAVTLRTTVLIPAEEVDQAIGKKIGYRAPGK